MWLLSECNVLQVTAGKHTPRASLRGQQGPPRSIPNNPLPAHTGGSEGEFGARCAHSQPAITS